MTNPRVTRGRRTESAIATYLTEHGWPYAERVPASLPGSDITGTPDIAIEAKARSDFHPRAWLAQAAKNADGRLPVAVVRCNGQGEQAGDYLAMVTFSDLVTLLREAGYGDTPVDVPDAGSAIGGEAS